MFWVKIFDAKIFVINKNTAFMQPGQPTEATKIAKITEYK